MKKLFRDRVQAGRLLADELTSYTNRKDVIVLGLPRGGVPVAFEVAKKLHVPLDVFIVRKLGVPDNKELAMGAISTGGVRVLNKEIVQSLNISSDMIDAVAVQEEKELERRELAYRGHGVLPKIKNKIVILVDDGIATGSTILVAVEALRQYQPARIIIAVPTAALSSYLELKCKVDEVIALITPEFFDAVGQWYENFSQTTDAEVTHLLEQARHNSNP